MKVSKGSSRSRGKQRGASSKMGFFNKAVDSIASKMAFFVSLTQIVARTACITDLLPVSQPKTSSLTRQDPKMLSPCLL